MNNKGAKFKFKELQKIKLKSNIKFFGAIVGCIVVFFLVYGMIITSTSMETLVSEFDDSKIVTQLELPTGTYVGEVSHGILEGIGEMDFNTGELYEGSWADNQMNGSGELKYTEGDYKGNFVSGKRSGNGTFTWKNGAIYEGSWNNDKLNGEGTMTTSKGTVYTGSFENNKLMSGTIKVKNSDGQFEFTVEGGAIADEITITFENGDTYSGAYSASDGCISGEGKMTFKDGGDYSGSFKNGKRSGTGTYTFKNGSSYEGSWKDDKMNGQGTYTFKNGDTLIGKFKDGSPSGTLDYTMDGDSYTTKWSSGKCTSIKED